MRRISYLILILLLGFNSRDVYAQWEVVANNLFKPHSPGWGGVITYKDGIVWAGVTQLFNSLDSGKTWTLINDPQPGAVITEICFLDKDTGAIAYVDFGIYLTYDRGNSWTHIISLHECFGLSFARNGKELFVADRDNLQGTVHYTSDGGNTWSQQQVEGNGGGAYDALYDSRSSTGYVLSRSISPIRVSHIDISSDFGKTWQHQVGNVDLDCYSFALDSCDPNKIYIGNEELDDITNNLSEMFVSDNNGKSWTSKAQGSPGFFSASLSSSPSATYSGSSFGQGIFRSTDRGATWSSIGGPSPREDTRLVCAISDNIIFATDQQGNVWRTRNSGGFPIPSSSGSTSLSTQNIVTKDIYGIIVHVPIIVKPAGELTNLDMMLHYDTTYLTYQWSESIPGRVVDIPGETWKGRSKLHFNASELTDTLIGYAVFKFFPQEIVGVRVIFDSLSYAGTAKSPCGSTLDSVKFVNTSASAIVTNSPSLNVSSIQRNDAVLATVKLNPNPTSGKIIFSSNEEIGTVKIEIVSQLGVMQKTLSGVLRHGEEITLDMNGLAEGTYYARILKGDAVRIIPFVYQR